MCETCGCSDDSKPKLINLQSGQTLAIGTANDHDIEHEHAGSRRRHHHLIMIITTMTMNTVMTRRQRQSTSAFTFSATQPRFAWKPMCSPRTTDWPSETAAGLPAAISWP